MMLGVYLCKLPLYQKVNHNHKHVDLIKELHMTLVSDNLYTGILHGAQYLKQLVILER